MQTHALSVQADEPGAAGETTQAVTGLSEPLISGPAPALWAGAGAFLLIFLVGMILIIRGRVTPAKSHGGKGDSRAYFEPAGEDAEIIFDEDETPEPARADAKADRSDHWRDDEATDTEITIDPDHKGGSLHEDAPELEEEPEAPATELAPEKPEKKKKSAFAGLFGKKPEPEPQEDLDDEAFYADEIEEPGFFAPEVEDAEPVAEPEPAPPARPPAPIASPIAAAEAARVAHAEEAAQLALKRAEGAESLARDLKRANEDAQNVMKIDLRKQEAALDQRAAALAELERRLAAMSGEFQERIDAGSAKAEKLAENAPASAPLAAYQDAPGGVSEEHFAEFANLMGEQFDALRGAVNSAVDKLSKRLDHLPAAPGAGAPTAARIQLSDLLGDALAPQRYKLRHKLSTGRTAEAAIMMPGPLAPIAVDARFPVEAFDAWHLSRNAGTETELRRAVLRNIADAGEKLISPEETADCAMMFIPSENILSEMHAHFSDLVQESYRARVFMVSPTSLMAALHTISAVMAGAGVKETSPANLIEELQSLRDRVAMLESQRSNGASPAKAEKPAAPAPHQPAEYTAALETPPRKSGESGDDRLPFPLR